MCFTAVRLNGHKRENEYNNNNTMEKMLLLFTVSDGTTTKALSVLAQTVTGAFKTERSST